MNKLLFSVLILLLAIAMGCAGSLNAVLLQRNDYEAAIISHKNAFIGTIVSGDNHGHKYIENYLLGSVPARAKIYAKVTFHIDQVVKGKVTSLSMTIPDMLANGQGFRFQFGDKYLVAFNGSLKRPRDLTLVPIELKWKKVEQAPPAPRP